MTAEESAFDLRAGTTVSLKEKLGRILLISSFCSVVFAWTYFFIKFQVLQVTYDTGKDNLVQTLQLIGLISFPMSLVGLWGAKRPLWINVILVLCGLYFAFMLVSFGVLFAFWNGFLK